MRGSMVEVVASRVALRPPQHSVMLAELVEANNRERSMKYGSTLALHNHLTALLTASAMLGADDSALKEMASGVETGDATVGEFRMGLRRLEADRGREIRISRETWADHLGGFGLYGVGSHTTYPSYLDFFRGEREKSGEAAVLETYFPTLAHGLGADFFHAIIELGYYFEAGAQTPSTLDAGMAWLAAAYAPWPDDPSRKEPLFDSPTDAFRALSTADLTHLPHFDIDDGSSGYINAMETLRDQYLDDVYAYDLRVSDDFDDCLKQICLVAADSFASGGASDFFTLHAVTGSRAVWAILQSGIDWPDSVKRDVLRALWRTILFTHLARRAPPSLAFDENATTTVGNKKNTLVVTDDDWPDLKRAALDARDSHTIKVVFTCADFYDRWRDPRHLSLAAAVLQHRASAGRFRGQGVGSKIGLYISPQSSSTTNSK